MGDPEYSWHTGGGVMTRLWFGGDLDNHITQSKGEKRLRGAAIYNGQIYCYMPFIMRACFELGVDLRTRPFLAALPVVEDIFLDKERVKSDFRRPLGNGLIKVVKGKLVIRSSPRLGNEEVIFPSGQVPRFVEEQIKLLDEERFRFSQHSCIATVNRYLDCSDRVLIT